MVGWYSVVQGSKSETEQWRPCTHSGWQGVGGIVWYREVRVKQNSGGHTQCNIQGGMVWVV